MAAGNSGYVMGHSDRERRRLALQATLLNPLTDAFLRRAGISTGMRVLDAGCGIGEVSLIAAELVGPRGQVHCIDIDETALETARSRARAGGHDHVTFERCEIDSHRHTRPYDAVVGRHLLLHVKDAQSTLRALTAMIGPGGVVAFQEFDVSFFVPGYPELPLNFAVARLMIDFFCRATPKPNIGTQLFHLMQQAGLPPPECRAEHLIAGGPDSILYEWIAETLRSILPPMAAMGMTAAAEIYTDDLGQRLREEATRAQAVVVGPMMVGAFARKPA
jgi:ubiquinone/menaquinone biosynthesis C-methylase UbiE